MTDPDRLSAYQQLWEHVCQRYALIHFDLEGDSKQMGAATTQEDEYDESPIPLLYWYREVPGKARLVLQNQKRPTKEGRLFVFGDRLDIDFFIRHLDLQGKVSWRADWDKDHWLNVKAYFSRTYCHRLMRQDDHGNTFVIENDLCERGANAMAYRLEKRGHKQMYWVERQ